MIIYNFPHRGPYEYDKFVLNYLQLHNEVSFLETEESARLQQLQTETKKAYEKSTGEKSIYDVYARYLAARI